MPKKNLNHLFRKRLLQEGFFQVIDEVRASGFPDESDLFLPRYPEMNVIGGKPHPPDIEKALFRQPVARRLVQVVSRPDHRGGGFVADDVKRQPLPDAAGEELQHTGKRLRFHHSRPIDVTLQFCPLPFLSAPAEMVAHFVLAGKHRGGDQTSFHRDPMKQIVVANNGVIKINAQDHVSLVYRIRAPRRIATAILFRSQLLHPLDVGINRVGERVLDQAAAISVGDVSDRVLDGITSFKTKHTFDFL